MLNLSLAAIARGGQRAQWEVPPDDPLWNGTGLRLLAPLRLAVEATPIGDAGVLVRGRLRTVVELECRRCVGPVPHELDEPIELLFEPLAEEEAVELGGEVYALPMRGVELALGEPLREQLLLLTPEYVVCGEACRGLCPQCGADRNRDPCACVPERAPSAWDALKDIKFD
jgi:uncharacterized protein